MTRVFIRHKTLRRCALNAVLVSTKTRRDRATVKPVLLITIASEESRLLVMEVNMPLSTPPTVRAASLDIIVTAMEQVLVLPDSSITGHHCLACLAH